MHYKHNGAFKIKMKSISNDKILIDKKFKSIDLADFRVYEKKM